MAALAATTLMRPCLLRLPCDMGVVATGVSDNRGIHCLVGGDLA